MQVAYIYASHARKPDTDFRKEIEKITWKLTIKEAC